jgi:hypothetical protein
VPAGRPPTDLRRFAARTANYVERKARAARRRLVQSTAPFVDPGAEAAEVLIYFPERPVRSYQLAQWLPVLERVAQERGAGIVLRSPGTYERVRPTTSLPIALVPTYDDLMAFYEQGPHKVVLYVNHGKLNFQSLTLRTALHVHVNHGESDKRSSFSNQAKAYDRVFVAGEIAARRYLDNVLEFDERRLVQVGRPPLDVVPPPSVPPADVPTVLYAPTWEGESVDNDWSSLRRLGVRIVEQLLGLGTVRVLYKPHPRVALSPDPDVQAAHSGILRLLAAAPPAAGHLALVDADLLGTFAVVDALVTDVSAVGLDFLFLRPESPILLTDSRNEPDALATATPLSAGADIVHGGNVGGVGALVASRLADDAMRAGRLSVRQRYFGDLAPNGESTARFLEEVGRLCKLRDELLSPRLRP